MYAVNAFAPITSPTTPQASVASMFAPNQAALGDLPLHVVPSALAHVGVQNNRQGAASIPVQAESSAQAAVSVASLPVSAAQLPNTYISGFPSLFLAQLMGQGLGDQGESLVVTYETMLQYSDTRYMPSNATKPAAESPMIDFFKALNQPPAPAQVQETAKTLLAQAQDTPPPAFSPPPSSAQLEAAPKPQAKKPVPRAEAAASYGRVSRANDQILLKEESAEPAIV